MKKLTNKKGFTLIEMLVVIAIIAVLVAIIIPVVTNSTTKAAAAADAANMRSVKSEIATSYLQDQTASNPDLTVGNDGEVTLKTGSNASIEYPAMKAFKVGSTEITDNGSWEVTLANNEFTVTYCGQEISWFATVAETGKAPTANNG